MNVVLSDTGTANWMPSTAEWVNYWHESSPLFEAILQKSLSSNSKLLNELLLSWGNNDECIAREGAVWELFAPCKNHNNPTTVYCDSDVFSYQAIPCCCEVTNKVSAVLRYLKQAPALMGTLVQLLKKHGNGISLRNFRSHLMMLPQFRALREMVDAEISSLLTILNEIVQRATAWLWKRFLKFSRRSRILSFFLFSIKHFKSEQEKLWPLLLSFKNA